MRRACMAGKSAQTAMAASVAAVDASPTRQSSVMSLKPRKVGGQDRRQQADQQPRAGDAEEAAGDADRRRFP